MMPSKKVTAEDVAEAAGVSRSSVSRAFTDGASIHPQKQKKILEAAKQLGYQPNFFARTLSMPTQKKRSNIVAILVSDLSNPYESYLFEVLSRTLQSHGKQPMLLNVKLEDDLDEAILRLSGYQIDGVVAVVGSLPADHFHQCLKLSLPLITLGRSDTTGIIPSVQTDNVLVGEMAAEHLLSLGLRKFGFLAGRQDGQASNERYQGFKRCLMAAGVTESIYLQAGSYSYQAGFDAAWQQREQLMLLDGIFCASDSLAMGLMDCCRQKLNLSIPQQLNVVGCDDIPMAAWQGYQLTTLAQPVNGIAQHVLALLEGIWMKSEDSPNMVRLAPELKVRESTKMRG
ncbi:LacI family DNA-binding transcriptional regulator [Providencia rustigianii]|uniref:LacI family DNA-binding transcriptional regulator n=1 Tax=Providencia rustigianii TaxID=158850 RepID=UPI000F6D3744|nr:substrate-binding domain-containing protein [Providencia rustigianii]MTC59494.1 LacI family DNA-binding transcriptional regulator [Providencia rustigianii]VEH53399.1 Catabolite control protein [Providencia rustigianii]